MTLNTGDEGSYERASATKSDEAYSLLRAKIVRCEMKPGATFNEKDLIDSTGYGRTPVREAVARLAHDGLVRTLPREGYQVTDLTEASVRDLFLVWRLIGPEIVRRAAANMSPAAHARLLAHRKKLERGADMRITPRALHKLVAGTFDLLAEGTGSPHLQRIYKRLRTELERVYTLYLATQAGREWARKISVNDFPSLLTASSAPEAVKKSLAEMDASLEGILQALNLSGR